MPAGVTTNIQLDQLTKRMHVPYFNNIFMQNALLSGRNERRNESGIVNLDDARSRWHSFGSVLKKRQSRDTFQ